MTDVSVTLRRHVGAHLDGPEHCVSIPAKLYKFGWITFPNKGRMNNRTDLNLASLFIYQLSFISQFLDLIYLQCKSGIFSEVTFCHFILLFKHTDNDIFWRFSDDFRPPSEDLRNYPKGTRTFPNILLGLIIFLSSILLSPFLIKYKQKSLDNFLGREQKTTRAYVLKI